MEQVSTSSQRDSTKGQANTGTEQTEQDEEQPGLGFSRLGKAFASGRLHGAQRQTYIQQIARQRGNQQVQRVISQIETSAIQRTPGQERIMDAGVQPPAPTIASPNPGPVSSQPFSPSNWLNEATVRANQVVASNSLQQSQPLSLPAMPTSLADQPSLQQGWTQLETIVEEVSRSWQEALPLLTRYLAMPVDEVIQGGGGLRLHDVVRQDGTAVAMSQQARSRMYNSPTTVSAITATRAAERGIRVALAQIRGAAADNQQAAHTVQAMIELSAMHRAQQAGATAEQHRRDAQQGRDEQRQNIQDAIRVLEMVGALLAGGRSAMQTGGTATTVGQAARVAGTNAVTGTGSNALHDLAVGRVAEIAQRFIDESWAQKIERANNDLENAAALVRQHLSASDQQTLSAALANQERAQHRIDEANQNLNRAYLEYDTAILNTAAAASNIIGGNEGRQAQASIAALIPLRQRITLLRQLQQALRVPSYDEASGYAYAIWQGPGFIPLASQFRQRLSYLIYYSQDFVPQELQVVEQRYNALLAQFNSIVPDTEQQH